MKIGAAQIDITPQIGGELSGFALRPQPSIGVLDRLHARAIYLIDGERRLLWLHCDLIGLDARIVVAFRTWAERHLHLNASEVMLTATHTHSGPCTIHLEEAGSYDRSYADWLLLRLEVAAHTALQRVEPCIVVTGETELDFAVDRRRSLMSQLDPRLTVVGFRRADGTYVGAIVNYAIHPVALGPRNRYISGDLFGPAADYVAQGLPGHPVVLMTNGACGNLNPPGLDIPSEQLHAWSRRIASAALNALGSAIEARTPLLCIAVASCALALDALDPESLDAYVTKITADPTDCEEWQTKLRRAAERWRLALVAAAESGRAATHRDVELFVVGIADRVFVGVNAEVFPDFTTWLRRDTGLHVSTLGYANGNFGYLCPEYAYPELGYEVETAHVFYGGYRIRAGEFERLGQNAAALVRQLFVTATHPGGRATVCADTRPNS